MKLRSLAILHFSIGISSTTKIYVKIDLRMFTHTFCFCIFLIILKTKLLNNYIKIFNKQHY